MSNSSNPDVCPSSHCWRLLSVRWLSDLGGFCRSNLFQHSNLLQSLPFLPPVPNVTKTKKKNKEIIIRWSAGTEIQALLTIWNNGHSYWSPTFSRIPNKEQVKELQHRAGEGGQTGLEQAANTEISWWTFTGRRIPSNEIHELPPWNPHVSESCLLAKENRF